MKSLNNFTNELFCFYNGFSSWEHSVIKTGDLSVSEAHAIEILGQFGEMNMKQLAEKLGVTTSTTTVTVDRLEKNDYAIRKMYKNDRRVYLICLTEKGKKAFEEHHSNHEELSIKILNLLSEEENKQFLDIIKKINKEVF